MTNLKLFSSIQLACCCGILLSACAINKKDSPIVIRGTFNVSMNLSVTRFSDVPVYPVSGKLVNDTPFYKQTIPAGAGIIGNYTNKGVSCSIKWTAIILPDSTSITNLNGIAYSRCPVWGTIDKDQIISASWN